MNVEAHRFSFEGSTTLLADHLTGEHGLTADAVNHLRGGLTQGHWGALDDLHREAHDVRPTNPMIEFHKTAEATAHTKKLLRDKGLDVWAVYSRYLPDTTQFRTTVLLRGVPTNEALSHVVAVLHDAGYRDVDVNGPLRQVQGFSALTGTTNDPRAELARRALAEKMPESYSADEVSAMSDAEAVTTAVSCGLMEA